MTMIPKIIHYCWLSNDPFPPLVEKCIQSWKTHLPDYEIMLWDLNKLGEHINPWVKEAVEAKKYAFAADYIRLFAVYTHGGIYLDSDVEVVQSFNPLLTHQSFVGFESSGDIEPAVFGAEPGLGWVKYCMDHYQNRKFLLPSGSYDQQPLPVIVSKRLADYFRVKIDPVYNKPQNISSELIFCPCDYFSPKNYHTQKVRITNNTYTIHHFDGNWVPKNAKESAKRYIHKVLYTVLGNKGHYELIKLIRRLND